MFATTSDSFAAAYAEYKPEALKILDKRFDVSENKLVLNFSSFIQKGFGVSMERFDTEKFVHRLGVKQRGRMDLLFGDLIFEFKRSIKRDPQGSREQLKSYLEAVAGSEPITGLLTDGLHFEAHTYERGEMRLIDSFSLAQMDADAAYRRLDAYLFTQTNKQPTAADIVSRFGGESPTFRVMIATLENLLKRVDDTPMLTVWREQWRRLLSTVYGSDVGSDELFLRHTYLCQFARLLAYAALNGIPEDDETTRDVMRGSAFAAFGVSNIGEADFFSWVLLDPIAEPAAAHFRRLAEGLRVYNLRQIDQDLLKQLYQNLVDPQTRHELGEYYTPDWLAELTLQQIDYQPGQSLYDPACGSGSFLFAAIKRLAAQGMTGWKLVEFVIDNVVGTDVHPLAVTVARVNYLLALADHLKEANPARRGDLPPIPVYMADALISPLENLSEDTFIVPVDDKYKERFAVPVENAAHPRALTEVIDTMYEFAKRGAKPDVAPFRKLVQKRFGTVSDAALDHWTANLRLLATLIHEERNGIWGYILKNLSRPFALAAKKFDVVAGNPPWLSYRYIKSREYQAEVKALYKYHGLIASNDRKLFTQMDLSTLFFAHARERYLKDNGTIAFVMPRSVITGAKQHRLFQARQPIKRVLDLQAVEPLFNVETCVLIGTAQGKALARVPSVRYRGRLPAHELAWSDAAPHLTQNEAEVEYVDSEVRSSHYYDRIVQGASLVPRTFLFVKPQGLATSPAVVTDDELRKDAKDPYKSVTLRGMVEDEYIYATLLSKHLLPFGYEKLHMVALPALVKDDGTLQLLEKESEFAERGHFKALEWFGQVSAKWDALKKAESSLDFIGQINYQGKLTAQSIRAEYRVLYNHSGTHLSSAVIAANSLPDTVHDRHVQGFIVDYKTYYGVMQSLDEAHYLCALLNAPCVDDAIKKYQSRGLFGERDIMRTPFEACAIPPFDPTNADHCELARLSQAAHAAIEMLKTGEGLKGGIARMRERARKTTAREIAAIDVIARRILA